MKNENAKYERIRDMRIERDITQKCAAQKLSIAQNTLSQYENGLRNVPNGILAAMALLYETSTDYLLGLTDEPAPYKRANGR